MRLEPGADRRAVARVGDALNHDPLAQRLDDGVRDVSPAFSVVARFVGAGPLHELRAIGI